jgi:hypothetical protein
MFILALSLLLTHDVWVSVSPNPAVMPIHNCSDIKGASSEKHIEVKYCLEIFLPPGIPNCNLLRETVDRKNDNFLLYTANQLGRVAQSV